MYIKLRIDNRIVSIMHEYNGYKLVYKRAKLCNQVLISYKKTEWENKFIENNTYLQKKMFSKR